jgi:hypothetical protein
MPHPVIKTAFPKRRYKFGEYTVTLLTDISSGDQITYQYLAAVVKDGYSKPEVYITCESISDDLPAKFRIRVVSSDQEHIIAEGNEWKQEQVFCDFALEGIQQMFGLDDEQPMQLS